jgi:predicted ABC-type ATPase
MFAGPNGSGKSSLYARLLEEGHFSPTTFLNADSIQARLDSGGTVKIAADDSALFFDLLSKSPFLESGLTIAEIHALSGNLKEGLVLRGGEKCAPYLAAAIVESLRAVFVRETRTFAFETVMSHESKLELLQSSRNSGYRNYLYFVSTGDPAINLARVRQRVLEGGHPVAERKVLERYDRCMSLLPRMLRLCDRAYLFDNSGIESRLVARIEGGINLHLETTMIPRWVEALLP